MSSSQAGPSVPKEEKKEKGLSKLLTRTKTFLKREGSSNKRLSTMSTKAAPASQPEPVKPRYAFFHHELVKFLWICVARKYSLEYVRVYTS